MKQFIRGSIIIFIITLLGGVFYFPLETYALDKDWLYFTGGVLGAKLFSDSICDIYADALDKMESGGSWVKDKAKQYGGEALKWGWNLATDGDVGEGSGGEEDKTGQEKKDSGVTDSSKVPVEEKEIQEKTKEIKKDARRISCENFLGKVIIARVKKRLLDLMVDQIVAWIQGGGEPQFVTNTGQFLRDAGDAAAGDVIQEIGMGKFCDGFSGTAEAGLKLQLNLQSPQKFSERISCTLSDVVDNLDDFRKNFSAGGFIGYQALMEPNNNKFGVSLLAFDEFLTKTAENEEIAKQEATLGAGFLANKICHEWTEILEPGENRIPKKRPGDEKILIFNKEVSLETYSPDGKEYTGKFEQPPGSKFRCTKSEVVTPGKMLGELTAKAIGTDLERVISAEDLTEYVSAIGDATINWLVMKAEKGLFGMPKLIDRQAQAGTIESEIKKQNNNLQDLQDEWGKYNNATGIPDAVKKQEEKAAKDLKTLQSTIIDIEATAKDTVAKFNKINEINELIKNTLNEFLACGKQKLTWCADEKKKDLKEEDKVLLEQSGICESDFEKDINNQIKIAMARSMTYKTRAESQDYQEFKEPASLISIPDKLLLTKTLQALVNDSTDPLIQTADKGKLETEINLTVGEFTKEFELYLDTLQIKTAQEFIYAVQGLENMALDLQNNANTGQEELQGEYERISDLLNKCRALPLPK